MTAYQKVFGIVNKAVLPAFGVPVINKALGKSMTVVTYAGRRSGKTIELPVAYKRSGDTVTIFVVAPDQKQWWRNFTGEGGPISLTLDGGTRTGHAVSGRDEAGKVAVKVTLDSQ